MNTIRISRRELTEIKDLADNLLGDDDLSFIKITQHSEESGIGYVLEAAFNITHKDVDGEFTAVITDHTDW